MKEKTESYSPETAAHRAAREQTEEVIEAIIRDGFPMPKGYPPAADLPLDVYGEIEMGAAAHRAVNSNDKSVRDFMRMSVIERLRSKVTLSNAEIAWLIYVLSNLRDMPCECRNGRPVDIRAEFLFRMELAAFIIKDETVNAKKERGYVVARLNRAASCLAKSYEAVRAVYYSRSFKTTLENVRRRGLNPPWDK